MTDDPRTSAPTPPFQPQAQDAPGSTSQMDPLPDHGERSYRGKGLLTGKIALITGADSGIGRAVAIAFAREGANVAIAYLDEHDDARETARWVREAGREAILLSGDVCDEAACQSHVARTLREFGTIDILINNAAAQPWHDELEDITAADIEHTYKTNVFAMFFLTKAAVPHMKAGSAIVNTTSINSKNVVPGIFLYATTKGAIATFTLGLSEMLAERGIRVNAVAPGPVWTPIHPANKPPEQMKTLGLKTPLKRQGQPAEVAPAFVLLASDEGSYMTGVVIPVTGGLPIF